MPEVTAPKWFEAQTYFDNKLAEMQLDNPGYTAEQLQAAFDAGGFTGDDGLYRHFQEYGNTIQENISPNAWFDVNYYMEQKLAQMQQDDPSYTMVQLVQVFNNANLTAWDHYTGWGMYEGLNPSSVFNTEDYMNAKLEQMRIDNPEYTMEQLDAAFKAADLNPIMHWFGWGENEDLKYIPGAAQVTEELTPGVDKIEPSPDNMILDGTVTSPAKNSTLNSGDQIDGGEGADTLNVKLGAAFNGFTGDGFMKNVETVNITNTAKTGNAQNFKATGIEGADTFNVTGNVNLSNLAAGVGVNLIDYTNANAPIAFTDTTVESLNLGVNNVATKTDGAVTIKAPAVDKLSIDATGEASIINLGDSGNAFTSLTVTGGADLTVTGVDAKLAALDASEATGKLDIDASAATALNIGKEVSLGSGDDKLVLGAAVDTIIDGGEGADEVVLAGADSKLVSELNLTNVETLTISKNSAQVTFSGANASGLETVQLDAIAEDITLAEFADDYTLRFKGHNDGDVLVADADTVTMVIGDGEGSKDASFKGVLTAAAAQSLALTVNTDADLDGKTFTITADEVTDLTITSNVQAKDLDLDGSSFKNLQSATLVSYDGIDLGAVGGQSSSVSIDASGVKGAAGLVVKVADYAGSEDGTDVSITGSNLGENDITINKGYGTIDVTGGLANDTIKIVLDKGADATITVNGGVGADAVTIDQTAGVAKSITLSGNLGGTTGDLINTDANGDVTAITAENIDASGLSGYLGTLSLAAVGGKNSTLVGGSGNDLLTAAGVSFKIAEGEGPKDPTPGKASFKFSDYSAADKIIFDVDGAGGTQATASVTVTQGGTGLNVTAMSNGDLASYGVTWTTTPDDNGDIFVKIANTQAGGISSGSVVVKQEACLIFSDGSNVTTIGGSDYDSANTGTGSVGEITFKFNPSDYASADKIVFDANGGTTSDGGQTQDMTGGYTQNVADASNITAAITQFTNYSFSATVDASGVISVDMEQKVAGTAVSNGAITVQPAFSLDDGGTAVGQVSAVTFTPASASVESYGSASAVTDTLTGGSGADTFVLVDVVSESQVPEAAAASAVTAAAIVVTDFQDGVDKLQYTGNGGVTAAGDTASVAPTEGAAFSGVDTFLASAVEALDGTVVCVAGQVGSNTFLAMGNGTNLTSLVQLTGVSVENIGFDDFAQPSA